MVRRRSLHRNGLRRSAVLSLAHLAVVALLAGLVTSCTDQPVGPPEEVIALGRDVLVGRTVLGVERVDTDSDGTKEWLAFYRFDQVEDRGPVTALIYDTVFDDAIQLPIVYPYKLRTPDQSYLAQEKPNVSLVDLVPEPGGIPRKELLFQTKSKTDLVFFRLTRDPGPPPTDSPPLYRCIGFFRSPDGVEFNQDTLQVTVTSRAGLERSDLVRRHFYRPEADGYFITGTHTLVSPFSAAVDFPAGIPEDILDTPYAEKIVLAFYRTFGQTDPQPKHTDYLSARAVTEFQEGRLRYGSPFPLSGIQFAVVKELSYYPTQDGTQATVVLAKVQFRSTGGELSTLTEVRWAMTRVDGRWKMDYPQS